MKNGYLSPDVVCARYHQYPFRVSSVWRGWTPPFAIKRSFRVSLYTANVSSKIAWSRVHRIAWSRVHSANANACLRNTCSSRVAHMFQRIDSMDSTFHDKEVILCIALYCRRFLENCMVTCAQHCLVTCAQRERQRLLKKKPAAGPCLSRARGHLETICSLCIIPFFLACCRARALSLSPSLSLSLALRLVIACDFGICHVESEQERSRYR